MASPSCPRRDPHSSGRLDEVVGTALDCVCERGVRKQACQDTAPGTKQARDENVGDSQSKGINPQRARDRLCKQQIWGILDSEFV